MFETIEGWQFEVFFVSVIKLNHECRLIDGYKGTLFLINNQ